MAAEVKKEIGLEIGHVLFIDIVGYSKLLITEQSEQIQKLREIMRGTVAAAQDELAREGYYHGPIDGVFSEDTHRAVKDFQRDNGLNETGYLSRETRNALELDVK